MYACMLVLGVATVATVMFIDKGQQTDEKKVDKENKKIVPEVVKPKEIELPIADKNDLQLKLKSKEVLLFDLTDEKVIFAKNADQKAFPASLTKMMTVLVAIEEIDNLHTKVTVPASIFPYITNANASVAGFQPNEQVEAKDLLYGVMLPSGADASLALALHVSGNEKDFVKLMNQKAKTLGMNNTKFKNVEGLHDHQHYTTAHDLMKLVQYAVKNPSYRKIFEAKQHTVASTSYRAQGLSFKSSMFSKLDMTKKRNFILLGGKTGYTPESGLSLASLASKNGKEYAAIVLNAPGTNRTEQFNILDTLKLYKAM